MTLMTWHWTMSSYHWFFTLIYCSYLFCSWFFPCNRNTLARTILDMAIEACTSEQQMDSKLWNPKSHQSRCSYVFFSYGRIIWNIYFGGPVSSILRQTIMGIGWYCWFWRPLHVAKVGKPFVLRSICSRQNHRNRNMFPRDDVFHEYFHIVH